MKQKPELQKIQENMQPGAFSAQGFLGDDDRNLADILREDDEAVAKLGYTHEQIAERMQALTDMAAPMLGRVVETRQLLVSSEDHRGKIPCPFKDRFYADKRNTLIRRKSDGRQMIWTDLHIHMIRAHGFYEGRGSALRLEPKDLVDMIM